MKTLQVLRQGWMKVVDHRGMWVLLYASNLVFALIIAWPFRSWLKRAAGHSLILQDGYQGFDFTLITDLLRNYGGFGVAFSQFMLLALVYVIFSAFLMGGIVYSIIRLKKYSLLDFMQGALTHFRRMLALGLFFILIHLIVIGIAVMVLLAVGINPNEIENDVYVLQWIKAIALCYLIVVLLVLIIHDYAKIFYVSDYQESMLRSIRASMRFIRQNLGRVVTTYLICLLLLLLLFILHRFLKNVLPSVGSGGVLMAFVLSQALLLGRILIKLLILTTANAVMQTQTQVQTQMQTQEGL